MALRHEAGTAPPDPWCQVIEETTGWSIKKFVRTTRRYRTVKIKAGEQTLTAADPLPADLRSALERIQHQSGAH